MAGAAGTSVRSGFSLGRYTPTVRLLGFKYVCATRLTSAAVAARSRSRCRKNRRQSPSAIDLSRRHRTCGHGVQHLQHHAFRVLEGLVLARVGSDEPIPGVAKLIL